MIAYYKGKEIGQGTSAFLGIGGSSVPSSEYKMEIHHGVLVGYGMTKLTKIIGVVGRFQDLGDPSIYYCFGAFANELNSSQTFILHETSGKANDSSFEGSTLTITVDGLTATYKLSTDAFDTMETIILIGQ
jgi:hypothetical protein